MLLCSPFKNPSKPFPQLIRYYNAWHSDQTVQFPQHNSVRERQRSQVPNVAVVRFIHNCMLENLLHLVNLGFVQSEGTVALHEVVDIDHPPLSEPILAEPLNEGLQLVARLQMRRSQHLVLHHYDVLVGVQLIRNGQFWHHQPQWTFNQEKHPQNHLLVALENCLVLLRIDKLFVVHGEVVGCERDQPKLFVFSIFMVLGCGMVFLTSRRQSSDHYGIDYLATFLQFLHIFLLLAYLHRKPLFLCDFYRFQDLFLEASLPVLIHEAGIAVRNRVKTGLVDLQQKLGDGAGVDPIVTHNSLRHVAK